MPEKDDNMQFDQAEFTQETGSARACQLCDKPLGDTYFKINAQIACEQCKYKLERQENRGGEFGHILKAFLLGVPAAALGAGIYYGISALTGYEFGLVSIVIGLLVGGAVKLGSGRRGGWIYQTIAIVLTYMAIASTYLPYAIQGIAEDQNKEEAATLAPEDESSSAEFESTTAENPATQDATSLPSEASNAEDDIESSWIVGILAILALTAALPFLAGFENIMGLIILGIGVYEAWKINKREQMIIAGPFQFGAK